MSDPITLPNEHREALLDIASYLETHTTDSSRTVLDSSAEDAEPIGYWQTPEWFEGLTDICAEIKRITTPAR